MYLCLHCHKTFTKPIKLKNKHGLDTPPYEIELVSPCCRDDFVETFQCDECQEVVTSDYIETIDGKRLCENCYVLKNIENN